MHRQSAVPRVAEASGFRSGQSDSALLASPPPSPQYETEVAQTNDQRGEKKKRERAARSIISALQDHLKAPRCLLVFPRLNFLPIKACGGCVTGGGGGACGNFSPRRAAPSPSDVRPAVHLTGAAPLPPRSLSLCVLRSDGLSAV